MGYDSIKSVSHTALTDLSAGWFPGKPFNDIPGVLSAEMAPGVVGAADCYNVAWYRGALRKVFGYSAITTSALNSGADIRSIYYSAVLDTVVGSAGNKIYDGLDLAVPTDITAALTISASAPITWTEWSYEADEYVVGTDGINPVFKYDGTGTATLVGGTCPVGQYVTAWQGALWIADGNTLKFSAIGSITVFDPDDTYVFDAPIRGIGRLNKQLVVFFDDHIGVLEGDNNRLLTKVSRFIDGVGCSSHFTIKNARLSNIDVLVFHANDGIYAYDGSQVIVKTSFPIEEKYTNNSDTGRWNHSAFSKAVSVYDINFDWYYTAMADTDSIDNDVVLIQDLKRPMTLNGGTSVPHWILKQLSKTITALEFTRSLDKRGTVLIGTDEGKVYRIDESIFTRAGSTYTARYQTKTFDTVTTRIVQELNLLGQTNDSAAITVSINPTLEEGIGAGGELSFTENEDLLDIAFIMSVSVLGGRSYALRHAPVNSYGRYLQFTIDSTTTTGEMVVLGIDMVLNNIGLYPNAGN